jgi:NitT/TauT family transport system ATP-binding protein
MTDSAIEVDHVTFRHADAPTTEPAALDDVSFCVRRGEFVTVAGPSGSGKTTLLRCVAGLARPSSGAVRIDGARIDGVPRSMAMVFQDYGRSLFGWMRIRENVDLPLRRLDLPRRERDHRVDAALAEVGLADAADRYPWQLSGGMQQRVAIARAVAYQPRILLMDEPFASVDAQTRADLQDALLDVWSAHGSTVLFVTHDMDEAVYLADRVLVLSRPPARVAADVAVRLSRPRDQVDTRASAAFAAHRAEVARLIMRPHAGEAER